MTSGRPATRSRHRSRRRGRRGRAGALWAGLAVACAAILGGAAMLRPKAPAPPPVTAAEVPPSVYAPYRRELVPALFVLWGADGMARIDELRRQAALEAAKEPACGQPAYSLLDQRRSSAERKAIFINVGCHDGTVMRYDQASLAQAVPGPVPSEPAVPELAVPEPAPGLAPSDQLATGQSAAGQAVPSQTPPDPHQAGSPP